MAKRARIEQSRLDWLPDDVLDKIWNLVGDLEGKWREVGSVQEADKLALCLPGAPICLDLNKVKSDDHPCADLLRKMEKNTSVKIFRASYCGKKLAGCSHELEQMFRENKGIVSAELGFSKLEERTCALIAENLQVVDNKLISLDLHGNYLDVDGTVQISNLVMVSTSLVDLNLSETRMSTKHLKVLLSALAVNKSIHKLNVSNNNFLSENGNLLGASLSANKTLQTLIASRTMISNSGLLEVFKGLKANTTLTYLDVRSSMNWLLYGNEKVRSVGQSMADCFVQNKVLKNLMFGGNSSSFSPDGFRAFVHSLEFSDMEELDLWKCSIDDAAMKVLIASVTKLAALKKLSLGFNHFTHNSCLDLLHVLVDHKAIVEVDLSWCLFQDSPTLAVARRELSKRDISILFSSYPML